MELRSLVVSAYIVVGLLAAVSLPYWAPALSDLFVSGSWSDGYGRAESQTAGWIIFITVAVFVLGLGGSVGLWTADALEDVDAPVLITGCVAMAALLVALLAPLVWLTSRAVSGFYVPLVAQAFGTAWVC